MDFSTTTVELLMQQSINDLALLIAALVASVISLVLALLVFYLCYRKLYTYLASHADIRWK